MPDPEERADEEEADEEEEPELTAEEIAAEAIDATHSDAEVFLRMAVDHVAELVDAKRAPKTLLDTLEAAYEELIELMPEDDD